MAGASNAYADYTVEFSIDGGSTFGNSFIVDNGASATVSVFLTESAPDSTVTNDGLLGFGLSGVLSSGPGEVTFADLDPIWDFPSTEEFTATSLDWEGLVFSNSAPLGPRVLLGQFGYNVTGEGTSSLTFSDIQPGSGSANANWLSGGGAELDEAIFGSESTGSFQLTFSTEGIPEPASATILAATSLGFFVRRRRKSFA